VFVVFIELKHLIPWVNFRLRDGLFLAVDKAACLGMSCGERVLEVFGPQAESLMSEAYLAFFPYLGFLLMVMVLQRNEKQAQLFCLSFALVWLLGILLVYLFPTLGPCFWTPEPFSGLKFSETALLRVELLQMSNYALAHPLSQKGAYLISGFPSLHLAAPTLGTAALWAVNRPLAILSLVFTVITMFSTLYFGWHYLLDNLGAIVLALGIYFVLERWWRG
jgi:membrane-associated phospholipid phosphatase